MSKRERIYTQEETAKMQEMENFLLSYQYCIDALGLLQYDKERKRSKRWAEHHKPDGDLLTGNEDMLRARMYEVRELVASMKNGREKLILYYHYLRGESIERAADLIGFSRRTGYRIHKKALLTAACLALRRQ